MSSNDKTHIQPAPERSKKEETLRLPGQAPQANPSHAQAARPGHVPPPRTPPPSMSSNTPEPAPAHPSAPQRALPARQGVAAQGDGKVEESVKEQARPITRDTPLEKNFTELVAAHQARVRQNNFFLEEPVDLLGDTIASSDSNPIPLEALLNAELEDDADHTVELKAGAIDLDWGEEEEPEVTSVNNAVAPDLAEFGAAQDLPTQQLELPDTAPEPGTSPLDDTMDSVSLNAAISEILEMEPISTEPDSLDDTMMFQEAPILEPDDKT